MLVTSVHRLWDRALDAMCATKLATIVQEVTETRNAESSKVNAEAKQGDHRRRWCCA